MKTLRLFTASLCLIVVSGTLPHAAQAGSLTVYVAGSQGEFGTLDLSNPADIQFASIGNIGRHSAGMGFTSNGNLYLLDLNFTSAHLLQINPSSGSFTDLGAVGPTALGATMGPDGNTMYAIDQNVPANLYTLAPPATSTTTIGNTGLNSDGLMAFGPSGTLYSDIFNFAGDALVKIDPKTGATTPIGTGFGSGILIASGTFLDGTFYGFGQNSNDGRLNVYTIDTTTGLAAVYGSYSLGAGDNSLVLAVAVAPSGVPEPSTFVLGAIAVTLMAITRMSRYALAKGHRPTVS